jgi:hypothetical protein
MQCNINQIWKYSMNQRCSIRYTCGYLWPSNILEIPILLILGFAWESKKMSLGFRSPRKALSRCLTYLLLCIYAIPSAIPLTILKSTGQPSSGSPSSLPIQQAYRDHITAWQSLQGKRCVVTPSAGKIIE